MKQLRYAGDLLQNTAIAAPFGLGGAMIGHDLGHDDMDFLVDDYRSFDRAYRDLSPDIQKAYLAVTARPGMTPLDRVFVGMALDGELKRENFTDTPKTQADIAVMMAMDMRTKNPQLANVLRKLNQVEIDLIGEEINKGTTPSEVVKASREGEGVTATPAVLGALAGGTAGALGFNMIRRGPNV